MPTFAHEVDLDLPAPVLCGALKEQNTLFPQIAPQVVASMEVIDGEAGKPGSVRKITYGPLAPATSFVKEKLISIDIERFTVTSEEIEGGHIAQGFTKFVLTMAVIPVGEDKSKLAVSVDYEGGSEEILVALLPLSKTESVYILPCSFFPNFEMSTSGVKSNSMEILEQDITFLSVYGTCTRFATST